MSEQMQGQERIASASEVAGFFRDDCRTLRDSLQLEMVVAQYLVRMRDVCTPQGVPVGDAVSAGVIGELERHGDPLSHAILRGLAHLGTGDTASRSADAVARLAEAGIGLPAKMADVGAAQALGAWRDTDGAYEGEYSLFVDFEHPLGARHALALFVEPRHGGTVKHVGLMRPMSEFDYPGVLETIPTATAGELLRKLLDRMAALTDDYRVIIGAARGRALEPQAALRSAAP